MKVRIDKSVFEAATDADRQLELSFLLHIIYYKHRYELKVVDEEVRNCDIFKNLMQAEQLAIEESLTNSIVSSDSDADCEVRIGGEQEWKQRVFSPSEAVIFLLQPLSVILENGLNDSHFMRTIFRLFDGTGDLIRHVDEGWIRFENAGGCQNVKNFIKARIGYYGEREKFLRCFVLLDGDKRYPTDPEPEKKYRRLKDQLNEWKVEYHVLEKRCMENYMPEEAIDSLSNDETKEWIQAYKTLTAEQKDCFCIAEGFRKDITKEDKRKVSAKENSLRSKSLSKRKKSYVRDFLPQNEKDYYQSVSPGNFLHLESGLKVSDFKVRFPEKFNDTAFTFKTNLLARTSHQTDPDELQHIANSIHSLL